jgi:protein-S-isoprenylcysteine O-methyltransferase Ste14
VHNGGVLRAAIGSALFFCIAPGTVVGLIPFLISRWRPAANVGSLGRLAGGLLLAAGLLALIECFVRFVVRGQGTPAPAAAPRRLVVSGLYRHVRNPMYVALVVMVVGQAIWLGSTALATYALVLCVVFHLRVLLYEEPRLAEQFGTSFQEYRRRVPRWIPRVTPWSGTWDW